MFAFSSIKVRDGQPTEGGSERHDVDIVNGTHAIVPTPTMAFKHLDIYLNGVLLTKGDYLIQNNLISINNRNFLNDNLIFIFKN